MLSLENVTKRYGRHGEVVALDDVSLSVGEGEFLILSGPSGAGKTTMLRLIFAAEQPDGGRIKIFNRDIGRLRRASIPYLRRNIGVVFQDFKLLPERTALENVALALEIRALPRREIHERAADALASVGLAWKLNVTPRRLSAGEQQRVAIARAVVGQPAILLCDEPTGNLDPKLTQDLLQLFSDVHRRGTTVLLATHDLGVMACGERLGWRRVELEMGKIVPSATPNVLSFPISARVSGGTPAP
ncbi:MAG: ATP-binding cassette domain-containing protein [Deltaproteobacteria bacterium]|nr:ATP-binding cassette domain-containing protein [Deltaproteobacteria bacterium]